MALDQLDLKSLGAYLADNLPAIGPLREVSKFAGGQSNPTYLLTTAGGQFVLRRKPPGKLLKSAHAVDREYRVQTALLSTAVPVARTWHLCEDDDVIGSMFYIMDHKPGRIFWNPLLPDLDPGQRSAIYDEMNRVLAALHDLNVEALGLADYGYPGNYFERQIGRWTKQYRASETEPLAAMDTLIDWLPANMPADDGSVSLIHGDYRLDNMIFAADEPRVVALLDWELSTLGHPYADLAYQLMQWHIPNDEALKGLAGADLAALGIPGEEQYVARYCERRNLGQIPNWNFYLVFSLFRLAAILQGVLKRAMDGNASSDRAFAYGKLTPKLAQLAVTTLESGA